MNLLNVVFQQSSSLFHPLGIVNRRTSGHVGSVRRSTLLIMRRVRVASISAGGGHRVLSPLHAFPVQLLADDLGVEGVRVGDLLLLHVVLFVRDGRDGDGRKLSHRRRLLLQTRLLRLLLGHLSVDVLVGLVLLRVDDRILEDERHRVVFAFVPVELVEIAGFTPESELPFHAVSVLPFDVNDFVKLEVGDFVRVLRGIYDSGAVGWT